MNKAANLKKNDDNTGTLQNANGKGLEYFFVEAVADLAGIELELTKAVKNAFNASKKMEPSYHEQLREYTRATFTPALLAQYNIDPHSVAAVGLNTDDVAKTGDRTDAVICHDGKETYVSLKHNSEEVASDRVKPNTKVSIFNEDLSDEQYNQLQDLVWNKYPQKRMYFRDWPEHADTLQEMVNVLYENMIKYPPDIGRMKVIICGTKKDMILAKIKPRTRKGVKVFEHYISNAYQNIYKIDTINKRLNSRTKKFNTIIISYWCAHGVKYEMIIRYKNKDKTTHGTRGSVKGYGASVSVRKAPKTKTPKVAKVIAA